MKIIVSCHCDTVWTQPYAILRDGIMEGANDNFASMLALGSVLGELGPAEVQLTEDEEMYMDGARNIAEKNNPKDTLIIVMDVTEALPGKDKLFTIENVHEIKTSEIRQALKGHKFRIVKNGTESEAWLYAKKDFSVLEIDVPVKGGVHNLQSKASVQGILAVGKAIIALIQYFKDKEVNSLLPSGDSQPSDVNTVGSSPDSYVQATAEPHKDQPPVARVESQTCDADRESAGPQVQPQSQPT